MDYKYRQLFSRAINAVQSGNLVLLREVADLYVLNKGVEVEINTETSRGFIFIYTKSKETLRLQGFEFVNVLEKEGTYLFLFEKTFKNY
tara:strand:+ start:93 stop:359 length:267 start_codon:yes stop_codon:yes gene_type:complete